MILTIAHIIFALLYIIVYMILRHLKILNDGIIYLSCSNIYIYIISLLLNLSGRWQNLVLERHDFMFLGKRKTFYVKNNTISLGVSHGVVRGYANLNLHANCSKWLIKPQDSHQKGKETYTLGNNGSSRHANLTNYNWYKCMIKWTFLDRLVLYYCNSFFEFLLVYIASKYYHTTY